MFKTPLNSVHKEMGARMVEFGGWEMPVQYSNLIDEHIATRENAGIFDISHMGEIFIEGPAAGRFLQYLTTNDIKKLSPGRCMYSCFCNNTGGIIDDLFIYMFNDEKYMIVVNAGTIEKDISHINKNIHDYNVKITNKSNDISKLDLQGPKSKEIIKKGTEIDPSTISRFGFVETRIYGHGAIISRTGYTGEDGFEIYISSNKVKEVWKKLLDDGKEYDILPVGLGARDTLRVEAGYSLYGHELNDEISPIEAGIGFVVKNKEENFIGKEILLKQKKEGTSRKHICFEMMSRQIPREKYVIHDQDDNRIGFVTSGTFSPTFKKGIGMGYIESDIKTGSIININVRNNLADARVVSRPFYRYKGGN